MTCTADEFLRRLVDLGPWGAIRMGGIFSLAKACAAMSLSDVERLLDDDHHEVRVGAVSIMDFQARNRRTSPDERRALFELYIRRHDRIDTWDLVDRSAIWVVGEYLVDRERGVLDELAASPDPMRRRTAILATYAFIRRGELDDTYRIAERLSADPEDTVHKGVGWMLREAGKRDEARLRAFLDRHAPTMPRIMLRYAIEKLDAVTRKAYLGARSA